MMISDDNMQESAINSSLYEYRSCMIDALEAEIASLKSHPISYTLRSSSIKSKIIIDRSRDNNTQVLIDYIA
jgi:hypothetical protein